MKLALTGTGQRGPTHPVSAPVQRQPHTRTSLNSGEGVREQSRRITVLKSALIIRFRRANKTLAGRSLSVQGDTGRKKTGIGKTECYYARPS